MLFFAPSFMEELIVPIFNVDLKASIFLDEVGGPVQNASGHEAEECGFNWEHPLFR